MRSNHFDIHFRNCENEELTSNYFDPNEHLHHEEMGIKLAEEAFRAGNTAIARRLIEKFFQLDPQKNQYYCRAKILLGLIIHDEAKPLNGPLSVQRRKEAIDEILLALDIATSVNNITRYQFVVYNCSLAFWSVGRSFLRKGRAHNFAAAFEKITNALERQDDQDKEWRIHLLSAAAFCFYDDNNIKAASDLVDKAISITESLLTSTIAEEKKVESLLQLCKKKVDELMSAYREIEEREELLRKPRKIDPDLPPDDEYYTRPIEYPPLQGMAAEGKDKVKAQLDLSQADKSKLEIKMRSITDLMKVQTESLIRFHRQRVAVNTADGKRYVTMPNITKDLRTSSLVQLQCILSSVIIEKEVEPTLTAIIKKIEDMQHNESRSETLLDISRACWMLGLNTLASKCMNLVTTSSTPISRILRVKLDICEAQSIVKQIETTAVDKALENNLSIKQIEGLRISKRLEAIKMLERTLVMSVPLVDDKFLIQEMCIIMWNTIVPLLTNKLRLKVHSALKSLTTSLESIECDFLGFLRSQVHYELALCEDASDYAGLALIEIGKSYDQDYGDCDRTRIVQFDDKESFDLNRVRDQYLHPLKVALNLRVDVYNTPSLLDDQIILWLQQAKESSSKAFVKEMVTKAGVLLFREMNNEGYGLRCGENDNVDWSIEVMKLRDLTILPPSLDEIDSVLHEPPHHEPFSYSFNKRLKNLITLAELAYSIQDTPCLQKACFFMLSFKWEPTTTFAYTLIEWQIRSSCFLAESFVLRIQAEATSQTATKSQGRKSIRTTNDLIKSCSLGIFVSGIPSDILRMKKMAVSALRRGFILSMELKDIFAIQNILIYFWNLHLHVVRKKMFENTTEEVVEFLKLVTSSADTYLMFSNSGDFLDAKLILAFFEVLGSICFAKGNYSESLSQCTKALQITFSAVQHNSTCNSYLRKNVMQMGSYYNVLNALQNSAANAKSKDAVVPGPLIQSDNPLLNVFGALTIAESDSAVVNPSIPSELVAECLEKAEKIMLNEVPLMIQREQNQEDSKQLIKTKENKNQRLEMLLECYTRLSRLRSLRGDFVGAQDWSERGLKCFQAWNSGVMNGEETLDVESAEGNSRIFRWVSNCEQCMALAISSFLDASDPSKKSGHAVQATLDPELIRKLQFVAVEHLYPAVHYAVLANEELLMIQASRLASVLLQQLLSLDDYQISAFDMGQLIVKDMSKLGESRQCQIILQSIYLSMITSLVLKKEYDRCLKLIVAAFEVIDQDLQKDLWPARVICMSRKGLNVLDGLQKLKEKDPLLQGRVLILFARATKDLGTKFSVFMQAIDMLDGYPDQVEYMLELAEVMSVSGMPRAEIKNILKLAISSISSWEEKEYDEIKEWDDEDETFGKDSAVSRARSVATAKTKQTIKTATVDSKKRSISPSIIKPTTSNTASKNEEIMMGLDFRMSEQAMRAYSMSVVVEWNFQRKLEYACKAVYYIKRCFELWIDTIRHCFKQKEYAKIKEGSKLDFLEFQCDYPAFMQMPTTPIEVYRWANSIELRNATWELIHEKPFGMPTLQSLPSFAASVVSLFSLVENLCEFQVYDNALYAVSFAKLLLWSTPSRVDGTPEYTPVDRQVPLLAFQCLAMLIMSKLGVNLIDFFRDENFIIDRESKLCSPGVFLYNYINEANRKFFSQDINREEIFDLAYQDIIKQLHQHGGYLSPFDIDTTALFLDSMVSIDQNFYWYKACHILITLGQYDRTEQLLLCLLWESRRKRDIRQFCLVSGLLLKISYLKGEYEHCIIHALRQRELLHYVGDCEVVKEQFSIALRSYFALNLVEEAKQLYHVIVRLIQDLASRKFEKPIIGSTKSDTRPNTSVDLKVQTTLNASQSKVTIISQNSRASKGEKLFTVSELGWEYVDALKTISLNFIDVSGTILTDKLTAFSESKDQASIKDDVLKLLVGIDEVFENCLNIMKDTAGDHSFWELQLHILRARKSCDFFRILNSSVVRNQVEQFQQANAAQNIAVSTFLHKSLQIARRWMESFTQFSCKYQSPSGSLSSILETTVDTSLNINPVHISSSVPQVRISHQEANIVRFFGVAAFEMGSAQMLRIVQSGHYRSPTNFKILSLEQPSIIDQYLVETACPTDLNPVELIVPDTIELHDNMVNACDALRGTKYEPYVELLSVAALVAYLNFNKHFDASWISADKVDLTAALKFPTVDPSSALWRTLLMEKIAILIDSGYEGYENLIASSIIILLESLGSGSMQIAAKYVIWLQSLKAKWWLHKVWLKALDKRCQAFISYTKIAEYQKSDFPNAEQTKAYQENVGYLANSCTPFRRLSISEDPLSLVSIFEQHHPHGLLMWIQCCPYQKTIFLACYKCAGPSPIENVSKGGKSAIKEPVPIADASMQWFFDKMDLTEQKQRTLQQLIQQQHEWQQDMGKFLAVYGEHLSDVNEDAEESTSRHLLPSQKYERALEERFRAIVQDFEHLFQELLGRDSKYERYLVENLIQTTDKPTLNLMVSPALQMLPWESLILLDEKFEGKVCRDFSFHLMCHRLQHNISNSGNIVSGPGIKLLVDPWKEDNQLDSSANTHERSNLTEFWRSAMQTVRSPTTTTSKWQNLREVKGVLSAEDFTLSFDSSGAIVANHNKNHTLLVNCFGRLGSIFPPKLIASMNLPKLGLIAFWEGAHCENSFRRQNSTDILKTKDELELEEGIHMCVLLSLAGASTLVTTLWPSPIKFQHRFAQSMLKSFTDPKKERIVSSVANVTEGVKLKKWIKFSKVVYGIGAMVYSDT